MFGASEGCGPGFVNCLAPGVVPPTRLRGRSRPRPCCAAGSTASSGRCRASPSRSASAASGQAIRCSASRNSRPAITRPGAATIPAPCSATAASACRPSCATAASSRSGPTDFAFEPYRLLRSGLGLERGRAVRPAAPGAELGRRRRPRRLWRPLPARRARSPSRSTARRCRARRGDTRLLVSLTARLWPWRSR